jgi:hypothetical protein
MLPDDNLPTKQELKQQTRRLFQQWMPDSLVIGAKAAGTS